MVRSSRMPPCRNVGTDAGKRPKYDLGIGFRVCRGMSPRHLHPCDGDDGRDDRHGTRKMFEPISEARAHDDLPDWFKLNPLWRGSAWSRPGLLDQARSFAPDPGSTPGAHGFGEYCPFTMIHATFTGYLHGASGCQSRRCGRTCPTRRPSAGKWRLAGGREQREVSLGSARDLRDARGWRKRKPLIDPAGHFALVSAASDRPVATRHCRRKWTAP